MHTGPEFLQLTKRPADGPQAQGFGYVFHVLQQHTNSFKKKSLIWIVLLAGHCKLAMTLVADSVCHWASLELSSL